MVEQALDVGAELIDITGFFHAASQSHIITSLPLFKMAPTSGFEMCFALGSQHLRCRGSQRKHASNPDSV